MSQQSKQSGVTPTTKTPGNSTTDIRSLSAARQNNSSAETQKGTDLANRRKVGEGVWLRQGIPHCGNRVKRYRNCRKKWPRHARDAVQTIEFALQIHVSGFVEDPGQDALTIFIEQDCWPDAQFVLQKDETMWRLAISTRSAKHQQAFSEREPLLVQRFAEAELGSIALSLIR